MSAASGTVIDSLRTPAFALFWLAQTISRLGDPITLVALAAITYRLTGSAFYTSIAVLIATVPQATFGFFAGAIADAVGHRRTMVASDALRAILIGAIPIALVAGAPLALAYVLAFLAALCAAAFGPARLSLIPALVPADRLTASNALVFATDRSIEIVGLVLAGLLVASIGEAAFYVDALTFAISAALLSRIGIREPPMRPISWAQVWHDAASGLGFIRRTGALYANTIFSLVAQLSLPVFNGLLPVLVFRRFAAGDPELGARQFGIAEAAVAAGAVIAGLLLPRYLDRFRKGQLVVAGLGALGAGLILVSLASTFESLIVVLVFVGVANVIFYVPNLSISQELTPPDFRARVFGARMSLLSVSWLPVVLAGGALGDLFDVALLIGVAGAFTLLVALAAAPRRILTGVR